MKLRGAATYELINGRLLHNRAYHHVPGIRVAYPVDLPDQGLVQGKADVRADRGAVPGVSYGAERHTGLFQELYAR